MTHFAAHTHVIGSAVLVRLCGDFTAHQAPGVKAIFDQAAEMRPDLVIDMRSTGHIDPAGMHVMTDHHQRRIEINARMYVAAPSPSCAALMATLPLSIFDHADAALLALAGPR